MDKRKPAKLNDIEEDESRLSKSVKELGSSDDEEANEDLSLKIVEKALSKRSDKLIENGTADFDAGSDIRVVNLTSVSSQEAEVILSGVTVADREEADDMKNEGNGKKKKKRKKRKSKIEKFNVANDDGNSLKVETGETVETAGPNAGDTSSNVVLRKLLRGPRYFDMPDSGWETCFNCGDEGHMAVNCPTAVKRKKPCFVCGSLEHGARNCSKSRDCYICKKSGHRAKDCPDKNNISFNNGKICLRCGDSGHDMFVCTNDYLEDDLKEIQCYVCKSFGHLCCAKYTDDTSPREVSCYRCGQLGHTGLACGKSHGEYNETPGMATPSSCFKCGEEGHFARECVNFSKRRGKAIVETWEPWETSGVGSSSACFKCGGDGHFARECASSSKGNKRRHDKVTKNVEFNSAPHLNGRAYPKRKKFYDEGNGFSAPRKEKHQGGWINEDPGEYSTPRKEKHRGGWINEDPGEYSERKPRKKRWKSPSTPSKGHINSATTAGGHYPGSQSSKKSSQIYSAARYNYGGSNDRRDRGWW